LTNLYQVFISPFTYFSSFLRAREIDSLAEVVQP